MWRLIAVNFYNTLLVIVTMNCVEFLKHTLSNCDGKYIEFLEHVLSNCDGELRWISSTLS